MRVTSGFFVAASCLTGVAAFGSGRIIVAQESSPGAGDFDANPIAVVAPYSTTLTAEAYYDFSGGEVGSFGPAPGEDGPVLTNQRAHLFFLLASDGLSLVHVYDHPTEPGGGTADQRAEIFGDTAEFTARDGDPGDDSYTNLGGTVLLTEHIWPGSRTDGMGIGALENEWEVILQFEAFTGLTSWSLVNNDDTEHGLVLEVGRRLRIRSACPGDVDLGGGVDFGDLNAVLGAWATSVPPCTGGDVTGDGMVNFDDLNLVLAHWGDTCP